MRLDLVDRPRYEPHVVFCAPTPSGTVAVAIDGFYSVSDGQTLVPLKAETARAWLADVNVTVTDA